MAEFEVDERVDITDVVCPICKGKSGNGRVGNRTGVSGYDE